MTRRWKRLTRLLGRRVPTPEDIAAAREASRIADEITSDRIGAKSQAGENYLSQRRSRY